MGYRLQTLTQSNWNCGSTHLSEAHDLLVVGNRHDSRDDARLNADTACPITEIEIITTIEEQLGGHKVRPAIDLGLEVLQVELFIWALRMCLRVASHPDTEVINR